MSGSRGHGAGPTPQGQEGGGFQLRASPGYKQGSPSQGPRGLACNPATLATEKTSWPQGTGAGVLEVTQFGTPHQKEKIDLPWETCMK